MVKVGTNLNSSKLVVLPSHLLGLEGDIQLSASMMQRNAIRFESQKWPGGEVPYVIDWQFGEGERAVIGRAFDIYLQQTCVRFVPRTNGQRNYVHLVKGSGCSSAVGMVGGRQEVSLGEGCVYTGIILHELMHALGEWSTFPRYYLRST